MAIKAVFYFDGNDVMINEDAAKEVREDFRPGIYKAMTINDKLVIEELELKEKFNPHYSPESVSILKYIDKFTSEDIMEEINSMGFVHKLGIFMHGTHGTGKTSLMNYICSELIDKHNAVALVVEGKYRLTSVLKLAEMIRNTQNNLLIVIFDEIDEYAEDYEAIIKSFTDGQASLNNTICLAATNYMRKIPDTLLRPSRFKVVVEIKGIKDINVVRDIVDPLIEKSNMDMTDEQIQVFCKELIGKTLDDIKTAVLDKVMNLRLEIKLPSIGFKKNAKYINNPEEEYERFKRFLEKSQKEEEEKEEENIIGEDLIDAIREYEIVNK